MMAREMRCAARPAHHPPHGLGARVVATRLEAHDDEVEILHVVVLRGIDAPGGGERRVALAVERREVRVEHGHRLGEPARAVLVERGLRVLR